MRADEITDWRAILPRRLLLLCVALLVALPGWRTASAQQIVTLSVDATDIRRKLFHSELAIPVRAGPLTLVYPKWIPGYHAPVGMLNNIVRLKMMASGQPLEWKRDLVDMFAFHVVVPDKVSVLDITMDVVAPTRPQVDLGSATAQLFVLEWNTVVLYPEQSATDEVRVRAQIRLPQGWQHGCAIAPVRTEDDTVEFPPVSLTTLVDSPLLSGKFFRTLKLTSDSAPPVFLELAAETPEALHLSPEWETRFRRLVTEGGALFGGYPYPQYHFQLALSNELGDDGIEHSQSSDNRMGVRLFTDDAYRLAYAYLLPHEYVHAWNGKYRRPVGLTKRNFQEAQTGELLWVYEGLTRYLNWVLAARSGIFSLQEARDYAALLAAQVDHRSGREWRSLQDTAISAQLIYFAPSEWQSLRRALDYYDESLFLWLQVDTIIRRETHHSRSLDDFCRVFFASARHTSGVKIYTFEDVVAALNSVLAYDWATFFKTALNSTGTDPSPLDGLLASGWSLAYGHVANSVQSARDEITHRVEERFSLGLLLQSDGTIVDVVRDSPAWNAGLGPGMKLMRVDQRPWSSTVLREALAADRDSSSPLRFSVQNGSLTFQADIRAPLGLMDPQLEHNNNPDVITEILNTHVAGVITSRRPQPQVQ